MLEILLPAVFLVLSLVLAYKKRKKRALLVGPIRTGIDVGALPTFDCILGSPCDDVEEPMFLLSIDVTASMKEHTANEGPILFGIAHSDYTAAQIEEYIENTAGWSFGNLVQQEINSRGKRIKIIGRFSGKDAFEQWNDGIVKRIPCKFRLENGETITPWAYNEDANPLTAGSSIQMDGKAYLVRTK